MLAITLERYMAVCHPLRALYLFTCKRAEISILIIVLFAVCFNIPLIFEKELKESENEEFGLIFCTDFTMFYENSFYFLYYRNILLIIFHFIIPFIGIAYFNAMIYRKVRQANRERQNLSTNERNEIRLSKMLFAIVIMFFAATF